MVDRHIDFVDFDRVPDGEAKSGWVFVCGLFTLVVWNKPVQDCNFGTRDCSSMLHSVEIKA